MTLSSNNSKILLVGVFVCMFSFQDLFAQADHETTFSTSSIASFSSKDASFWLNASQFGLYGSDKVSSMNIMKLENKTQYNQFEIYSNVSPVLRIGDDSEIFLQELYVESNFRNWRLLVGKKEWTDGFAITDLGFGSMIWSSNAAPIPKITLEVKDWTKVPFTWDLFSFRGYYSHGWFEEDRFVESSYLHEKALYLYLGKDNWPVQFRGAVIHNVMWAGNHPSFGNLPDKLDDYINIVTFQKGDADEENPEPVSFQGSTVGAFDFGIKYMLSKFEIQFSKQFYIESRTSTYFRSPADGLWRLEWQKNNQVNTGILAVSYEFLNMFKQDARRSEGETRGSDQTYFNFIYLDGWTYKNRIIGIPLVQTTEINNELFITNNIFLAHNVGIRFSPSFLPLQNSGYIETKFTYSRSYGRTTNCPNNFCTSGLSRPYRTDRKDQYSMYLVANIPITLNLQAQTAIALDIGDLYESIGFRFGITYNLEANRQL